MGCRPAMSHTWLHMVAVMIAVMAAVMVAVMAAVMVVVNTCRHVLHGCAGCSDLIAGVHLILAGKHGRYCFSHAQ